MTTEFSITAVNAVLPLLGEKRLNFGKPSGTASYSTILVGRNGSGKSTILRELAMAMRSYFPDDPPRSRHGRGSISQIEVSSEGESATLNLLSDVQRYQFEREALRSRKIGPSKVIALSFMQHDKFPPDESRRKDSRTTSKAFYVNLGAKSAFQNSPRARLMRSIEHLADAHAEPQSDERIIQAFEAIDYLPEIKISYTFGPKKTININDPDYAYLESLIEELKNYVKMRSQPSSDDPFYVIDFANNRHDWSIPMEYGKLRTLMRAGVLRVSSVMLRKRDGEPVELLELSSGELNLLSGFLGLAAHLTDGSVILIDEPENSLHPDWQVKYVGMLEAVLNKHQGCHYIIATHSPLIVSGVASSHSTVLRLDQEPIEVNADAVSDASPDATLLNAFSVVTAGNNFIKHLVLEAFTFIETGNPRGERPREIANFLAKFQSKIPENDPLRELVGNVVLAIQGTE